MNTLKTAALQLKLIDNVSGPAGLVTKAMAGLNGAVDAFNANRLAANRAFMDATWQAGALAAGLVVPIRAASRLEDAMADVRKVTELSDQALAGLRSRLIQISRETPLSADELANLAAELAAAEVASADLEKMTLLAARSATAWGITGPEAATNLAKVRTALGMTNAETERYADQINALSDATASTAPDLLDFGRRVGSMGKMFGFTTEQTLAIGSAMISAGATSEQAATGFQAVGRALVKGVAATSTQEEAFERLGLKSTEVAKAMSDDALGTVEDVLSRVRNLPDWERASVMNQLFGDEARTFLPLVENTGLLSKTLGVLADEGLVANSVLREFEKRISTTSGKARQLRNRITAAGIAFGNALLPSVQDGSDVLGVYADRVSGLIERNPELVKRLTLTTAGLVAMRLAATGARMALFNVLRPTNLLIAGLGYLAFTNFDSLQAALKDLVALGKDLAGTALAKSFLEGAGKSLEAMGRGAQQLVGALRELTAEGSGLRAWLDSVDGAGTGAALGAVAVGLGSILAATVALRPIIRPLAALVRLVSRLARLGAGLKGTAEGVKAVAAAGAAAGGGKAAGAAAGAVAGAGDGRKGAGLATWLGRGLAAWSAYDLIASIPSGEAELKQFMEANRKRAEGMNAWLESNVGTPRQWAGVPDKAAGAHPGVYQQLALQQANNARAAGLGRTTDNLPGKTADDLALNVQAPVDTQVTVQLHGVMVEQVLDVVKKTAKQVVDQAMSQMQGALNSQLSRSSQTAFGGVKPYGD
ncbi:MAG: phage tail tape measure protein [Alphaproteobacteria bacterium]|nr:phage tail tape measure protein [Alphaproteobacteria bacterium]